MKRTEDRKRAAHKALTTLLDSINCWPMEYKDLEKLVEKTYAEFH